jgi:hypothetical protein
MTSDDEDSDFDGDDLISAEGEEPQAVIDNPLAPALDLNDFDDDFDDDFEAEVAGEYELDDDEYARLLVDMVDFEIEGLSGLDDDAEPESDGKTDIEAE